VSTVAPRSRTRHASIDILVADDQPGDNLMLALAAQEAGADVAFTFVDDGEELLLVLAERTRRGNLPDVLMLDLRMPRCSGLEVLALLAGSEVLRTVPIVMFTVSRREVDRERGLALGATRFVNKPSSYGELMDFTNELAELAHRRGDAP
jgi:CheY-like chemotaxis protein